MSVAGKTSETVDVRVAQIRHAYKRTKGDYASQKAVAKQLVDTVAPILSPKDAKKLNDVYLSLK
jgi:hypothetical protein